MPLQSTSGGPGFRARPDRHPDVVAEDTDPEEPGHLSKT